MRGHVNPPKNYPPKNYPPKKKLSAKIIIRQINNPPNFNYPPNYFQLLNRFIK